MKPSTLIRSRDQILAELMVAMREAENADRDIVAAKDLMSDAKRAARRARDHVNALHRELHGSLLAGARR